MKVTPKKAGAIPAKELDQWQKIAKFERIIGQKRLLIDFQPKMMEMAEQEHGIDINKKSRKTIIWYWYHRELICCSLNMYYLTPNTSKQAIHQMLEHRT